MTKKQKQNKIKKQLFDVLNDKNYIHLSQLSYSSNVTKWFSNFTQNIA